ncbi:MAG: hypothetical protein MI922_06305 [Bacteroidales bacterium]|nr:hypothetical protein [Bacteroidales bacterium]
MNHLPPLTPEACNADILTAWTQTSPAPPLMVSQDKDERTVDVDDLLALPLDDIDGPIDLESLDPDQWIRDKESWFKGQFPWIFVLREALKNEGHNTNYPELLLQTGDL